MIGLDDGPTRGAFEQADDARWEASPIGAFAVRLLVVVGPVVGAFFGLLLLAEVLFRPPGVFGLIIWLVQGVVIGTVISMTLERLTRGLLPLATLFNMSLMFPDQAPSRYGVALRSGTLRQLAEQAKGDETKLLGEDVSSAATRAIEYITALGRHDRLTRGHTERVRAYAELIGGQMGLSETDRAKLTWGVMLHDIGKMSVPPEVLNKSGKLTDEEWNTLKGHPEAGGRMLTPLQDWLGPWALAASEHHERWDGGGYPRGLKGEEISLAGRITAVADAYDVITSKRSYKEPMSPAAARRELVICSGTQFDPEVVRAFLNVSLRRRWSGGLLAALTHLPVGNLGSAPVAVTISAVVAGGAMVSGMPPAEVAETLAFGDTPTIVEPVEDTTTTQPVTTVTVLPATDTTSAPDTSTVETTTSTSTTPTTSSSSSTTSTTATSSTTAAPTTAAPTTAAPTTAAPTTAAPTTTTTAPPTTTTTAPPTTTTTAPTTTTSPPGTAYYLDNRGSDGQDTTAQLFKQLELSAPVDGVQYNFDTDRDATLGLSLQPTTDLWSEDDTPQIQRYFLDAENSTIDGPITFRLWAATDSNGATMTVRASIADCTWTGLSGGCSAPIAEDSATVTTWVDTGFEELTFDFGNPSYAMGNNRYLVLRVIAEGGAGVHTAFDSTVYPSRITLTVS